jgi:peptidoglycan/xylan/chitin deacetylase (PgdA/CDA1 family)
MPGLSDAELARELTDSRAALEDALGEPVTGFAYPYGAWDARCAAAVKAAGYAYALTTDTGWALRDGDPYRIRRLAVFNDDTARAVKRKAELGRMDVGYRPMLRYWAQRALDRVGGRG